MDTCNKINTSLNGCTPLVKQAVLHKVNLAKPSTTFALLLFTANKCISKCWACRCKLTDGKRLRTTFRISTWSPNVALTEPDNA